MLRHPLFTLPLFAVLAGADAVACFGLAGRPLPIPVRHFQFLEFCAAHSPGLHAASAALAAILAAAALPQAILATRLTLLLFFLVLTGAIPVIGIALAAALALILRQPATGGVRPEEKFVFGNPEATAARREAHDPGPSLTPLAEGFRSMDEAALCQAILGLKHLGPPQAILPFLLRFQQDPRTSIQFTAQAVLSGAIETLEETVRVLRSRLSAAPDDPETRLALAETLENLAAWTPPHDATTLIRRREAATITATFLADFPANTRALQLGSRLQLAAADGGTAQHTLTLLSRLDPPAPALPPALLESLFHQARWDDLSATARRIPPPPGHAETHSFWTA